MPIANGLQSRNVANFSLSSFSRTRPDWAGLAGLAGLAESGRLVGLGGTLVIVINNTRAFQVPGW